MRKKRGYQTGGLIDPFYPFPTEQIQEKPVSKDKKYVIQKGDSLGLIAKKHNISVSELSTINKISNPNKIVAGQSLTIPSERFTIFSEKDLKESSKKNKPIEYDTKKLYQGFDSDIINNKQVILEYHKKNKIDKPYTIIDKKTNTLYQYDADNNLINSFRVGLGKKSGDDKYTVNSKNERIDRNSTPGGIYTIDEKNKNESYRQEYNNNIALLKNERGMRQATAIHQLPNSSESKRRNLLENSNPNDDDFSNGCVNCTKEDFLKFNQFISPGQNVYILPEEEGNFFTEKNGKLAFTTNRNKNFGQYNFTPKDTATVIPFNLEPDQKTEYKGKFLDALANEKANLMKDLNLSSDEYDELAKRAYGIFGQESSFGEGSWNPKYNYKLEKLYVDTFDTPTEKQNRSLGLTQVRPKFISPEISEKYGINAETLYNPYQAAIATMDRLADGLQVVKNSATRDKYPNLTPDKVYDYATTFYNKPEAVRLGFASGENSYVQNVNKFASELKPKSYASGGPLAINSKEVKSFDSNKLKAVQLDLKNKGLYKGKIDGIYGPLTEEAINGYNSNITYERILPEFNVVSAQPGSSKLKDLQALKVLEEEYDMNAYNLWEKGGKPKIYQDMSITGSGKNRAYYNPLNNSINIRSSIIPSFAALSKDDQDKVKEFLYSESDTTSAEIESIINNAPKIEAGSRKDYLAEIAHSIQNKSQNLVYRGIKDWFNDPYITDKGQRRLYNTKGSLEHDAHSIIEPQLERYTEGLRISKIDVPLPELTTLNYQTGGSMRTKKRSYANGGYANNPYQLALQQALMASNQGTTTYNGLATDNTNIMQMAGGTAPLQLNSASATNTAAMGSSAAGNAASAGAGMAMMGADPYSAAIAMAAQYATKTIGDFSSAFNYKPTLGKEKTQSQYTEEAIMAGLKGGIVGLIPTLIRQNKDKNTMVWGSPGTYATGGNMDQSLSNQAFQVKDNPGVTDGKFYPEYNANLDHNEVVDKDAKFVFSDDLKMGDKSFAQQVKPIYKKLGEIENRKDPISQTTAAMYKKQINDIAMTQEELATALGLRNNQNNNFTVGGFTQGPIYPSVYIPRPLNSIDPLRPFGVQSTVPEKADVYTSRGPGSEVPVSTAVPQPTTSSNKKTSSNKGTSTKNGPWEGFDATNFQTWYNSLPGAKPIAVDGKWGPATKAAYEDVAHDYLSATAKNWVIPSRSGPQDVVSSDWESYTPVIPSPNGVITPSSIKESQKIPPRGTIIDTPEGSVDISQLDGSIPVDPTPETMADRRQRITVPESSIYNAYRDQGIDAVTARNLAASGITPTITPQTGELDSGSLDADIAAALGQFTLGDALQGVEVGSKFFNLLEGPETEPQILNTTPITKVGYDPRTALMQNQRNYQNMLNSVGTSSMSTRRALANSMLANKLNVDNQVLTDYQNMNNQALVNYENRLSNQRQQNIASEFNTNNLNAANRGAYDQAQQNAFTSLGNFGEALNRKQRSQDMIMLLKHRYPDIYDSFMKDVNAMTTSGKLQLKFG